jgi:LCP family protein required for cell wall assembly
MSEGLVDQPAPSLVPPPQQRTAGIALRRGIVLVLMTLVVPGSAQLVAGNRKLGKLGLRVWLAFLTLLLVAGVAFLVNRSFVIGIYANSITLTVLSWLFVALGVGWAFLALDAWWIANPRNMSGRGRVISGIVAILTAVGLFWGSWSGHTIFAAQAGLFGSVFSGGGSAETVNGRYNILLLGADSESKREGVRPDSITVASIDAETGRTVLFSLPRNLQRAPFPKDDPLYAKYPNGYYCPDAAPGEECMLNGIYTEATNSNNKALFKGIKNPGIVATADAVSETLGLEINYWAIVDMDGFKELINAVGGIRLDVNKRVPIGSKNSSTGVIGYIEKGKNQLLDGRLALWFARSREGSTDYERMVRQKCVMNAMLKQLNPQTVFTKFEAIADAGKAVVKTNLPASDVGTMLDLAQKVQQIPMTSVSFVPPLIKPANPDFKKIRQTVQDEIDLAEEADIEAAKKAEASAAAKAGGEQSPEEKEPEKAEPSSAESGTASPTPKPSSKAQKLDSVCKAS